MPTWHIKHKLSPTPPALDHEAWPQVSLSLFLTGSWRPPCTAQERTDSDHIEHSPSYTGTHVLAPTAHSLSLILSPCVHLGTPGSWLGQHLGGACSVYLSASFNRGSALLRASLQGMAPPGVSANQHRGINATLWPNSLLDRVWVQFQLTARLRAFRPSSLPYSYPSNLSIPLHE